MKKNIPNELKSLSLQERKEINDFIKSQRLTGVARTQAQIMLARQAIIEREKRLKNLAKAYRRAQLEAKPKVKRGRKKGGKNLRVGMYDPSTGQKVRAGSKRWYEIASQYKVPELEKAPWERSAPAEKIAQ